MIEYSGVSKTYSNEEGETRAVTDVSFRVEKGELVVLVGPSGSGKTTLLRMTNRLEEPDTGEIFVSGSSILKEDEIELRRRIGYVIQQVGLFPHRTVAENIATVPRVIGWEGERISRRVDEMLELMNLSPEIYRQRYPHQLSGGERQRVGVARALAADPDLLLMDEPFGAIDPINRKQIQDQFLRLQEKLKKTILFVTHDIQEALKMGDKIAIFCEGELKQYATPQEILLNPASDFVRDFVGTDRGMKVLELVEVEKVMHSPEFLESDLDVQEARMAFARSGKDFFLVCDGDRRPTGFLGREQIEGAGAEEKISKYVKRLQTSLSRGDSLREALNIMVTREVITLCVTDSRGQLQGLVAFADIQDYLGKNYSGGDSYDPVSA